MMYETDRRDFLTLSMAAASVGLTGCMNGRPEDVETVEVEPETHLVFEGHASRWHGLEPELIEGLANPTLVLEEGGEYVVEWVNEDGATHDLQIQDERDNVVDGLATDLISGRGERASLEFTASPEMTQYVCTLHRTSQRGRIRVE